MRGVREHLYWGLHYRRQRMGCIHRYRFPMLANQWPGWQLPCMAGDVVMGRQPQQCQGVQQRSVLIHILRADWLHWVYPYQLGLEVKHFHRPCVLHALTMSCSYSGTDVRANVAYDTFVGYSCGGAAAFEVMVWLADMGSQIYPLSNNGYPPTPSASPYIGNAQFNLVIGTEGDLTVYSFVAAQYAEGFSADLLDFYKYLVDNEGFPSSAYLQVIQAGSEVFTGSDAYFSTSSYSISQS